MDNYKIENLGKKDYLKIKMETFIKYSVLFEIKYRLVSDKSFNRKYFKKNKGYWPDLEIPKSFSEKLLYLKMHYRNPLQVLCADKYYVREYIKLCGYESILKDVYYVGNDARKVPYENLPDKFFVRTNHMSGFNYAIDKAKIDDFTSFNSLMNQALKLNYYHLVREWCYKDITPKILCEELLQNKDGSSLVDYKFYCFSGEPRYYMISKGEFEHNVVNHKFDMEGNSIDKYFKKQPTLSQNEVVLPDNFDEMVKIVKKLCKPFPHVRVDLYNIDGRIVFGELTFYSNGGVVNVSEKQYEDEIGSWIDLEKYKNDYI